jgi:hypothetical protein
MGDDFVQAIAVDAAGNVYAAGTLGMGTEIFVREFGADGGVLLDRRWPSTHASISDLASQPLGGVVLTVIGGQAGSVDLGAGPTTGNVIAAIDASGSVLWQRDSGPLDANGNGPRPSYVRVAIGPSGDIAARGTDAGGPFLALLDPAGTELWRRVGIGDVGGLTVAVDASGYITTLDWPWLAPTLPGQAMLVRYAPTGNLEWRVSVADPNFPAIATTPSGDVVVVDSSSSARSVLRRYRAVDGALLSAATIPLLTNRLVAADETRVVVAGSARDETGGWPWQLGWYDLSTGGLSTLTLGAPLELQASSLALVPGGAAFLGGAFASPNDFSTGTVFPPRGWDVFVVDFGP